MGDPIDFVKGRYFIERPGDKYRQIAPIGRPSNTAIGHDEVIARFNERDENKGVRWSWEPVRSNDYDANL